jgi:ribosomal protein S18 acetylase RimI-like enzyme
MRAEVTKPSDIPVSTNMKYIIRQMLPAETTKAYKFLEKMFDFSYSGMSKKYGRTLFAPKNFELSGNKQYLLELLSSSDSLVRLVIESSSSRIVGISVKRIEEKMDELNSLYLDESFRGMGIGKQLVAECIGSSEGKPVWLNVFEANSVARNLYEKLGFVLDGHASYDFRWCSWPKDVSFRMMRYVYG